MPHDEELMSAAAGGDLEAFEAIVRAYRYSAWNTAYRFLGDAKEAEDVVQEAFLRLLDVGPRYRPTASFRTYLYRILSRLCQDRAEKKRPICMAHPPETPDNAAHPDQALLLEERRRAVSSAIARLSPNQRMAIILRYYEGLGYQEIAGITGTTEKAVERLMARARAGLERTLATWLET